MKRIIPTILLTILLATLATAASKPITANTNIENEEVDLFVKVEFLGDEVLCTVTPKAKTSNEGVFSTNLANLVLVDNKGTRCDGLWSADDDIWYEIQGKQSPISTIEKGTGLQELSAPTNVKKQQEANNNAGGSSSGSASNKNNHEITLTKSNQMYIAQTEEKVEIQIVLFDSQNNKIKEKWLLKDTHILEITPNEETLEPGKYYFQAFTLINGKIVASSKKVPFFTTAKTPKYETPKSNTIGNAISTKIENIRKSSTLIGTITFTLCFIILGVVLFILAKRQRYWDK